MQGPGRRLCSVFERSDEVWASCSSLGVVIQGRKAKANHFQQTNLNYSNATQVTCEHSWPNTCCYGKVSQPGYCSSVYHPPPPLFLLSPFVSSYPPPIFRICPTLITQETLGKLISQSHANILLNVLHLQPMGSSQWLRRCFLDGCYWWWYLVRNKRRPKLSKGTHFDSLIICLCWAVINNQGERFVGAISSIKARAPVTGGNFGIWGGLFSTFDCTVKGIRQKEDAWNAIISGFMTGGTLALRSKLPISWPIHTLNPLVRWPTVRPRFSHCLWYPFRCIWRCWCVNVKSVQWRTATADATT